MNVNYIVTNPCGRPFIYRSAKFAFKKAYSIFAKHNYMKIVKVDIKERKNCES